MARQVDGIGLFLTKAVDGNGSTQFFGWTNTGEPGDFDVESTTLSCERPGGMSCDFGLGRMTMAEAPQQAGPPGPSSSSGLRPRLSQR